MTTAYIKVAQSGDDGWYDYLAPSGHFGNSSPLPLAGMGSFFLFRNIPLLANSTVNGAYLNFTADNNYYIPTLITSRIVPATGELLNVSTLLLGNAVAPTDFASASGFPRNEGIWFNVSDWESGLQYETPNLSGILPDVLEGGGWSQGNSILFFVQGTGNKSRTLFSASTNQAKAAELVLDYDTERVIPWGFVPPSSALSRPYTSQQGDVGQYNWEAFETGAPTSLPVVLDDENFAYAGTLSEQDPYVLSKYLVCSGFPINIPPLSHIHGIELLLQKNTLPSYHDTDFVIIPQAVDQSIRLWSASGVVGDDKADTETPWTNNIHATRTYGGKYDTWGKPWATAEVNDRNFGVAIAASGFVGFAIDQVLMKVWHTPVYTASQSVNLFIVNRATTTSGITLEIHGLQPMTSGITLYTHGPTPITSGVPLFVMNQAQSGGVPLYTSGPGSISSGFPLFVWGNGSETSGVPLYINGPSAATSGFPLFTYGMTFEEVGFNLYVNGGNTTPLSSGTPLFTFGSASGVNAIQAGTRLYVNGAGLPGSMNLVVLGEDHVPNQSVMNLYTKGDNPNVSQGLPLYVGASGTTNHTNLFVQGDGQGIFSNGQWGGFPTGTAFNLFIDRFPAEMVTLFIANNAQESGLSLYMNGINFVESGQPLFCQGGVQPISGGQLLYTHGF